MRVLFLSSEHRTNGHTAYGHRLARLMTALSQQGVETDFLSLRDHGVRRPILAQPLALPFIQRKLAAADFIHAGGNAGYTSGLLRSFTRASIVQDIHGDSLSEAKIKWSNQRDARSAYWVLQATIADAITYRFGDRFAVVSRPLRAKLTQEHGIARDKIGIVRNGVDLATFKPRARPGRSGLGFVVAYAGGFQHWQGIENFVRAAELISDASIRFKIVGFGPGDAKLRNSFAERLGRRAELVDRVERDELVAQLSDAHALIIPRPDHAAVEAAFPTKFSEYIALGRPVIVSDVDETASLVRRHRCGLVAQPTPRSIADTIALASRLSPDELDAMSRNGRALAEREFSWPEIGRRYAALLTRWAAEKPAQREVAR